MGAERRRSPSAAMADNTDQKDEQTMPNYEYLVKAVHDDVRRAHERDRLRREARRARKARRQPVVPADPARRRTGMGKIVVSENITLDGVVQDPAGGQGFRPDSRVGPIGNSRRLAKLALDEALAAGALLLGRRSYEWLAARWPSRSGELADRLPKCQSVDDKNAGKPYDRKAYNSAQQKLKQGQKYTSNANKQKRSNNKKNNGKGSFSVNIRSVFQDIIFVLLAALAYTEYARTGLQRGAHRSSKERSTVPERRAEWGIHHFSLSNPVGEGRGDVPRFLRHLANTLEEYGAIEIQDISFTMEMSRVGWP